MKAIKLREEGGTTTRELLEEVVPISPAGMNTNQLRMRIKILDALDNTPPGAKELCLEDAEHVALVEIINSTSWRKADRQMLLIIDDILGAKTMSFDLPAIGKQDV